MKKFLPLQVFILFACLAFTANAQTDTTKIIPNLNAADPGHSGSKIIYNDTLFFLYTNASGNYNLAKYNSNNTFTVIPNQNAADPGFLGNFIIYNNSIFGQYQTAAFNIVWAKYDGTGITTYSNPDAGIGLRQPPAIFNGNLYCVYLNASNKYQVSKFDGTSATLISNPAVASVQVNRLTPFINYHNEMYVVCDSTGTSSVKRLLSRLTGSALSLIPNPDAGSGFGEFNAIYNDTLMLQYVSTTGGKLLKFDGTNFSFVPSPNGGPVNFSGNFVHFNNSLFFRYVITPGNIGGLAKYNGTQLVYVPNPDAGGGGYGLGPSSSDVTEMVVYKNELYAPYSNSSHKARLCKYDGNTISIIDDLADTSEIASVKLVYNNTLCVVKYIGIPDPFGQTKIALFNGSSFKPFVNANSTDNGPANNFLTYKGKLFFTNVKSVPFFPSPGIANLGYILSITSQQNVTCNGGNDGWAKVTPPPCGAGSNTFLWSPGGQTTDSIGGLTAGSYSVRIICGTDTTIQAFTITQPAAVNAPTTSNQSFCFNATVANLSATGTNIKWYTTATGGTALVSTTPLTDGTKYYASQTINGCESAVRAADSVSVQIAATPVTSNQSFCGSPTVANLIATGTNIKWYLSPTGGFPLATSAALINGTKYYATQTTGTCESAIRAVDSVTVYNTPSPATSSLVIYTGSKTLNQLDVPGTNIQFYTAAAGGSALAGTTVVQDDSTYFVTQTQNGCESNPRKQIVVNRIANDSLVLCSPATVAGLTTTPQTGNPVRWYDVPSGGTALSNSLAFSVGTDTLYVEEGFSVPLSTANYFYTMPNNPGSILWNMTYGANDTIYFLERTGTSPAITNNIYKIKADGTGKTLVYSVANPNDGRLLYVDSSGTKYLYFAQTNSLKKINLSTNIVTNNTLGGSITPGDLEYDPVNKVIYFGDTKTIYKFNTTTGVTSSVYTASSTPGIAFITGLTYVQSSVPGSSGKIFFGEQFAGVYFLELTSTPTLTQFLPSGGAGTYNAVEDIDMLPNGTLLVGRGDMILNINQSGVVLDTLFNAAILDGAGMNISFGIKSDSVAYFSVLRSDPGSLYKLTIQQPNVSSRVPVTVIVNPEANVVPAADTTVCNGSAIPAINFATTTTGGTVTYNWTNSNTSIGLAASGTGNIASFVAANPSTTPLAQTATIIVTPTITNAGITCEGIKDTFLITVNPTIGVPVIANQVVCNGAPTTAVSFGGPRRAAFTIVYNWTNNTPSIGLAASGTGNIPSFTAINNGNAPVTATITVTPTYTNNGVSCIGTPRTFTITANPTSTVDTVVNQVICNGANTTAINFSSATTGGTIVYDWTNSNTIIGLAASGTGNIASFAATNTGTTPDTATIIVTPTFTNGDRSCIGTARTFKIIVNPTATVTSISNKVECNGSVVAAVTPSSPNTGGTVTYTWVNNNTAIGLAASGTGTIPSFTATNSGTSPITATVTISPTFTNGGVSCVGTNLSYTITVNPPPVFNAISSQVTCNGSSTSVVPFTTSLTGGTAAFAWTNNNTAIGLAASGNGSLPSFTATNNTTAPITGTINVVMTYTNAGLSCISLPQTFTYTVNPAATVNPVSDQVVCNGSPVAAVNFGTVATDGTVTYTWTNNTSTIGLAASGTGNIASFNAVNTGAAPVTATITVTPSFANGGVNCAGTSRIFTITVNPTVTVNNVSNQVVCNGNAVTAVNFGTSATGGTTTYTWSNNTPSVGLAASGTGNIASFIGTNTTTAPVTATITVTPTFTNGGVSCVGASRTFAVTVNPTATVNAIANHVVCNGGTIPAINFGTNTTGGSTTYAWTNNIPSIGLAASGTGNIATFNATNATTAPVTATITVTPTFTNGGISCTGTSRTFTITVNPTATVTTISNKAECNGSAVAAVIPSTPNTGGTVTYAWVNNNTAIGLAASGTGTIPGFTATNTGTSPVTATVTVTPTLTNAGISCTGTSFSYTITVNPPPVFNVVANQVACNGSSTPVVPFSTALTGGSSVFSWTNSNPSIGLAANGTGNLPAFTATNNTNAPISGTISVVMTYTNAGLSCISLPQTFTYTVNPTATVNAIVNQTLCNRAVTNAINFSSPATGGSIVYNWTNSNPSIGLAASGSGNIAAFTARNLTAVPVTATITVTPVFSNGGISCSGTSSTFTITINPTPVTNYSINNAAQCLTGNQFVFSNTTAGGGSYTWNLGDGSSSVLTNVTKSYAAAGTYNVKLISTSTLGCMDSVTKTVTVYPQPARPIVVPEFGNGMHSSVVANSYLWFNNNAPVSNSNTQYFYPQSAGYHQVQVSTINGCSAKSDSLYYIPEKNLSAGVDGQFVFVYPVPVTNGVMNIHFNVPLVHKVECSLFTDLGQLLQKVEIPAGARQYKLNVKQYPKANYVVRFNDNYKLVRGLVVPVIN